MNSSKYFNARQDVRRNLLENQEEGRMNAAGRYDSAVEASIAGEATEFLGEQASAAHDGDEDAALREAEVRSRNRMVSQRQRD